MKFSFEKLIYGEKSCFFIKEEALKTFKSLRLHKKWGGGNPKKKTIKKKKKRTPPQRQHSTFFVFL